MSILTPPPEDRPEILVDFMVGRNVETDKHTLIIFMDGFLSVEAAHEYAEGFAYGMKLWQEKQNTPIH